jgi:hypothetical protein
MRPLFLLLILINLAFFTWQWQQQSEVKRLPSGPLAVAPNSNTLKLLSETDIPAAADNTSAPRSNALQEAPSPENP